MKIIAENGSYKLVYDSSKVNRYAVYKTMPMSPSGELKLTEMLVQSANFTPKLKSYFTKQQVQTAIAKVYAMKHVALRYK